MRACKRLMAALLAAGMLFSITGCLEHKSPDEYGYAMLIGVDKGTEKSFYVTMLLQRGNGDSQSESLQESAMVGVECEDMFEAVELLESGLPFALTLSRTSAIVFSEEIAMSGQIEELLSVSLGTLFIRYYANLMVARGRAETFLEGIQSELAPNIAKLQSSFIKYSEDTGYIPSITLAQFYDKAWGGAGDVLLPLGAQEWDEEDAEQGEGPAEGEQDSAAAISGVGEYGMPLSQGMDLNQQPPEATTFLTDMLGEDVYLPGENMRGGGLQTGMMGSAVFHDTNMIGILNGTHTQAVMMATGQFVHGRIHVPMPDNTPVSVLFTAVGKPRVALTLGENPHVRTQVSLLAAVEQPDVALQWTEEEIRACISTYMTGLMQDVFLACREANSDVFAFEKAAVVQFTDTHQWEAFDWPAAYAKLEATFIQEIQLVYNPTGSRME